MKHFKFHYKQPGFTLIETMMVIAISMIVLVVGIMYVQGAYRDYYVSQGEKLIVQVVSAAKDYHTSALPTNSESDSTLDIPGQYKDITTAWVVETGQIPEQYTISDSELGIKTPWSDQSSITVSSGSDDTENSLDDTYLYITVEHLPDYACYSLKTRLLSVLGSSRIKEGFLPTYTDCESSDGDYGPYVLYLSTNPQLY